MNPGVKTTGGCAGVAVVLVALLTGCSSSTRTAAERAATGAATSPAPTTASTPPVQDPDAPRLEPVSTTSTDGTVEADGEGCARMGQGRAAHRAGDDGPDPHALPAGATDHLRRVFAASTDVSDATAYREDDGDSIFICTGYTLREDSSGAMSAVIPVPAATSVIATVAGAGGGYSPGENVVDYYGYASDDVAHVVVTTPDDRRHLAAVEGHVWWAAPVVDEATAARSQEGTWQALDHAGAALAEGPTRPG